MNVVLFNPDEWRADCTGCYGHPVVQTPHLDRLAGEGTRFDQCHAQHPVCTPSRASFMTGWYPHVRGHRTLWHPLQPDEPSLLRYLQENDYDVRWYGKNDLLAPGSFAQSVTEAGTHPDRARPTNPWSSDDPRRLSFLFAPGGDPTDYGDYANVAAGMAFLREAHERPFCLYLPLSFPHPPYTAPRPYAGRYRHDIGEPLRPPVEGKPCFYRRIRESRRLDELDEQTLRAIRATYLGMCSYADWLLGELLRTLDETGLATNTVVIVFSDHGDWAGDYGLVEKWPSALDDTMTRVPLVIRMPGGAKGHIIREPVELVDLTPTVLDLAGIALEHTQFGRSLRPQLLGASGDPERAVYAEGGYDPHEPHCFEGHPGGDQSLRDPSHLYFTKADLQQREPLAVCRAVMIRTATHKLVRRPLERSELYDLVADPLELCNRYDEPSDDGIRRSLEGRLLDWYIHTADVTPLREDPRGYPNRWVGSAHLS